MLNHLEIITGSSCGFVHVYEMFSKQTFAMIGRMQCSR